MSEVPKTVEPTPEVAAEPATTTPAATESPEVAIEAPAPTTATESAPAPVKEESVSKDEAAIEATPASESVLGYKAPGLVKSLRYSKKFFWFSDEPLKPEALIGYLHSEKPEVALPVSAWSKETGKGLLFFAKRAEDKSSPAGIINLSEVSDVTKEGPTEFSFKLNGHKHGFQAATAEESASWLVAIETKSAEAKELKADITSRETFKAGAETNANPPAVLAPLPGTTPAETLISKRKNDPLKNEVPAVSDDEKKSKSRSQSRKRGSIFGALLGKKDEAPEEKKETKAEEGLVDKTDKEEDKIDTEALEKEAKKKELEQKKAAEKAELEKKKAAEKAELVEKKAAEKEAKKKELEEKKAAEKAEHEKKKAAEKEAKKKELEEKKAAEKVEHEKKKAAEKAELEQKKAAEKAEKEEIKKEKALEKEQKKEEAKATHDPVVAAEAGAAAVAAAVPAVVVAAEETKAEDKSKAPADKKSKRGSVFGTLFSRKESVTPPAEKTEEEATSTAAAKESETPTIPETEAKGEEPTTDKPVEAATTSESTPSPVEAATATETPATKPVSPSSSKGGFIGFIKKQEAKFIGKDEQKKEEKAAEKKVEEPAPVVDAVEAPLTTADTSKPAEETAAAAETPSAATETPAAEPKNALKDRRRSSLFGSLGTLKRKQKAEKTEAMTSDSEVTDGETKKSPLPQKIGGLFRKPSKVTKPEEKKDVSASATSAPIAEATEPMPGTVLKDLPALTNGTSDHIIGAPFHEAATVSSEVKATA